MNDEQRMTLAEFRAGARFLEDARRKIERLEVADAAAARAWLVATVQALSEAYRVRDAVRVFTAALSIAEHCFTDGRGQRSRRPVFIGDLVQWGAARNESLALGALQDLEALGHLEALNLPAGYRPCWMLPGAFSGEHDRLSREQAKALKKLASPAAMAHLTELADGFTAAADELEASA